MVYVTAARTNVQLVRILATTFQMDEAEKNELLKTFFSSKLKIGAYFGFNPETLKLTYFGSLKELLAFPFGRNQTEGEGKKRRPTNCEIVGAIRQLGVFSNKFMQGCATLIATNAPKGMLDLKDLSMTFVVKGREKRKKRTKISLVDYVFAVTSPARKSSLSKTYLFKLKQFHAIMSSICNIPSAFVKNPAFMLKK